MSWKLYYIKEFREHLDDPVINGHRAREIVREEYTDYPKDLQPLLMSLCHLDAFYENGCRIIPAQQATKEFQLTLSSLLNDDYGQLLEVDRRFRAYCVEFDVFLDYWYKFISHYKRVDGSGDQQLIKDYKQLFADLTHNAYDSHLEYRLLDLLRNHMMHVESPVAGFHVGIGGNSLYADREELLRHFGNGENKRKILEEQPPQIELVNIVNVTLQCLVNIHNGLMKFQIDDIIKTDAEQVADFIKKVDDENLSDKLWMIINEPSAEEYAEAYERYIKEPKIENGLSVGIQKIQIDKYRELCQLINTNAI